MFLISVFAMIQISMMTTPGGYLENVTENDFLTPRIIGFVAFMIGLFSLSVMISLLDGLNQERWNIYNGSRNIDTFMCINYNNIKFFASTEMNNF